MTTQAIRPLEGLFEAVEALRLYREDPTRRGHDEVRVHDLFDKISELIRQYQPRCEPVAHTPNAARALLLRRAEAEHLLTEMRCQAVYSVGVTMPVPLYERTKAFLTTFQQGASHDQ